MKVEIQSWKKADLSSDLRDELAVPLIGHSPEHYGGLVKLTIGGQDWYVGGFDLWKLAMAVCPVNVPTSINVYNAS